MIPNERVFEITKESIKKIKEMKMTTLQKRLLELKGKMTLREFADKVGIGQSTMCNYLHGRKMRVDFIIKVCDAFGVSADWLLGRTDDNTVDSNFIARNRHYEVKKLNNKIEVFTGGYDGATQ